jgi:hypothetical protein
MICLLSARQRSAVSTFVTNQQDLSCHPPFQLRGSLPPPLCNGVIVNRVVLLCKHRFWYCRILYDTFIVTKHIGWSVDQYPKHSEFIAQCHDHVFCCSESDKLASKTGTLNRILALQEPDNRCILLVDQYARMRLTGNYISSVVCVHKTRDNNRLTSGLGHDQRKFFSDVPVEVPPVCI